MKRCLFIALIVMTLLVSMAHSEETLTLYGKITVASSAQTLDLKDIRVADLQKLRGYLDLLPNLKEVVMTNTRISVAQLEELVEDYPGVRFDCAFPLVKRTVLTTQTAFSTLNTLSDPRYSEQRFAAVRHLTQLRALDLGHNSIGDLSFLYELPLLRVLILADNQITDLTPIASLTSLEYLELFQNEFTDISPLENLTQLRDLNLCRNRISDVTPLLGLTSLERLWLPDNFLTDEQKAELEAALPRCEIVYEWSRSTDFGWREHPRYDVIRKMFKTGAYIPFDP